MFCSLSFLGNSYTACSKSLASIAQAQRLIVLTFGSNQLIWFAPRSRRNCFQGSGILQSVNTLSLSHWFPHNISHKRR